MVNAHSVYGTDSKKPKNYQDAKGESIEIFRNLVKPKLLEIDYPFDLQGKILSVEEVSDNNVLNELDWKAGTDWLHIGEKGIQGIASRIQPYGKNFRTFTVRKQRLSGAPTEFVKRLSAVNNGRLYPRLTVQAYTSEDGNELLGFAVAKTVDILNMIERGKCEISETGPDQIGQATFYIIGWIDMKINLKDIFIYSSEF